MGRTFKQCLSDSISDYQQHIRPVLEKLLDGRLISVEGDTLNQTAELLDTLAGIDLWWVNEQHGMRGIASRIQPGRNWRTFTIRKERDSGTKTEYEKRKHAIDNEFLYPAITYQAYVGEHGVSIGIVHTKSLIDSIERGICYEQKTGAAQRGQATFFVVAWDDLKRNGYPIIEVLNNRVIHPQQNEQMTA